MAAPDSRFAAFRPHQVMFRLVLLQGLLILIAFLLTLGCTSGAGQAGGSRPAVAPTITTVVPQNPLPGGELDISGTGLSPDNVLVGGVPALTWRGNGDTSLVVWVPPTAPPGSVEVEVDTPLGIAFSQPLLLEAPPAAPQPIISSFAPQSGQVGTTVAILGSNLADTSQVTFSGPNASQVPAQFTQVSATEVKAVVPGSGAQGSTVPSAITGPITLTTPGGSWTTASDFIVAVPPPANTSLPVITAFAPSTGAPGQEVTLVGHGFSVPLVVAFGADPTVGGTALISSDTELLDEGQVYLPGAELLGEGQVITARVPAGVTSPATIYVLCGEGLANTSSLSPNVFTPTAPPTPPAITTLPASAAPGATVTFGGTGLSRATAIYFGGVAGTLAGAPTSTAVNAVIPAGAQTGLVTLVFPDQFVTSSSQYQISGPAQTPPPGLPKVTGLSISGNASAPLSGPAGTQITLTGSGFTGTSAVFFGGIASYEMVVNSDSEITAQVPILAAATTAGVAVDVAVATPLGLEDSLGLAAGTFLVTLPTPPYISSVTDTTTGSTTEATPGDVLTIGGGNFQPGAVVNLGGFNVPDEPVGNVSVSNGGQTITVQAIPNTAATGPVYVLVEPDGLAISPQLGILPPAPVPSLSGLSVASGPVGTEVTISGTNIDGVLGIALQPPGSGSPLEVTNWNLAKDGTSLAFQVPDGAVAGTTYSVQVAFGLATFPHLLPLLPTTYPFTVTAAVPVITDFSPKQGGPGTLVTLVGSGFETVSTVLYGGAPLPGSDFITDSDTEMRVLVPDDATASGMIGVTSLLASASTQTATSFTLLPSRTGARNQALVAGTNALSGLATLDFPANPQVPTRSLMFGTLGVPNAPVFHPRDPLAALSAPGTGSAVPAFTLSLQLPAPFYPTLPPDLTAFLAGRGVAPANVSISVVSEDYFWDGVTPDTGVYLFRPHYWTDPEAPYQGVYTEESQVGASLFEQGDSGIAFAGQAGDAFLARDLLVQGAIPNRLSLVTPSDSQFPLAGLDPTQSTGFWSLALLDGTAAVTLHLFFNEAEQANLNQLAQDLGAGATLGDLVADLVQESQDQFPTLADSEALTLLENLFRPLVDTSTRVPLADSSDDLITLTGTSLGHTGAVSLADEDGNGIPVTFENVSDTLLTVTVPRNSEGTLTLTTPYGETVGIPTP